MVEEEPILINKKAYQLSTDNIKFPTYYNNKLEDLLEEEVSYESFRHSFASFQSSIETFDSNYFNYIKSNAEEVIALYLLNNKNPMCYLLFAKCINTLCTNILNYINAQYHKENEIDLDEDMECVIKPTLSSIMNDLLAKKDETLSFLVDECYPNEKDVDSIFMVFLDYDLDLIKLYEQHHRCGLEIIDTAVKYCTFVFNDAIASLKQFNRITNLNTHITLTKEQRKTNDMKFYNFILKLEKIKQVPLCLVNSYKVNEDDILNKSESSPEWKSLKRILVRVVPNNDLEIKTAIDTLREGFGVMNVMINDCFTSTYNFLNLCRMVKLGIYYKFKGDEAKYDSLKLSINPNPNAPLIMCNLLKIWFMKKMAVIAYPKINFRRKIYLKRLETEITLDYINKINNFIYGRSNEFISEQTNKILPSFSLLNNHQKGSELYMTKVDNKETKRGYVSTRLLHTSYITFAKELVDSCCSCCCSKSKPNTTQDTLIIHLHGGGFIGTTTITHESYLRNWVNHLNLPLIGIDYSLSPQDQYPKAINDCWQAYNWIIKHAEEEFNIKLKRIILSGDSAGGTLALSLTYLLIVHQIRLPDLLLLEYPCCDTSTANMTNSMLLCMQDHLLSYDFLTYCNKAYRSNSIEDEDPFLNPERMPDNLLNKMPRTRFFIGTCDPLRDGSIRLLYKLSKTNVDCKGYDFKNYIHGFYALSSDVLKQNPTEVLYEEIEQFIKDTNHIIQYDEKNEYEDKENKNLIVDKII